MVKPQMKADKVIHRYSSNPYIRLCKWLKQLDSKLSPVKGFMGSNPLSMKFTHEGTKELR